MPFRNLEKPRNYTYGSLLHVTKRHLWKYVYCPCRVIASVYFIYKHLCLFVQPWQGVRGFWFCFIVICFLFCFSVVVMLYHCTSVPSCTLSPVSNTVPTVKLITGFTMQSVLRYGVMPIMRRQKFNLVARPLISALNLTCPSFATFRCFHSTPTLCAKKKNDKKNVQAEVVELPDMKGFDSEMERRLEHLIEEFSHIRPGRTSPDMFNHVVVEGQGGRVPMAEVGQITLKGTTRVTVTVFDPLMAPAVAKALRDCGMNINPVVEGASVNITMPKASSEARSNLMKLVSKAAEKVPNCYSQPT